MKEVRLGKTNITVPQNGFGALPIQRVSFDEAARIFNRAYDGGMRFFDTARAYSDSEEKLGQVLPDWNREEVFIATKTMARNPRQFWKDLNTSLKNLKTDYVDLYQFHCVDQVYRPEDGTGMYEAMLEAKEQGKIRHIGITTHKLGVAKEAIASGLYETLQFPFSCLSGDQEKELVDACGKADMGFIGMKGLAGGLICSSKAAMAFALQFDNFIPIWGVQKMEELEEWLSYFKEEPKLDEQTAAFIEAEKQELSGDFCRGCGYCMPCPAGIAINQCARMSLMLRRAPSASWLSEHWQNEMKKIEQCLHCNACKAKCPYSLDTPSLLQKNYEDYQAVLANPKLAAGSIRD